MKRKIVSMTILTLMLVSMVSLAFNVQVATGILPETDWLIGWNCRKAHQINSAPGAGTNYQVKIEVHYGDGIDGGEDVYLENHGIPEDFGDVRFTADDGVTELDYWMEEKADGDYAVFWVEVQSDLSSQIRTIYIYYGNNNAQTTSNGANTFLLFEDNGKGGWTDEDAHTWDSYDFGGDYGLVLRAPYPGDFYTYVYKDLSEPVKSFALHYEVYMEVNTYGNYYRSSYGELREDADNWMYFQHYRSGTNRRRICGGYEGGVREAYGNIGYSSYPLRTWVNVGILVGQNNIKTYENDILKHDLDWDRDIDFQRVRMSVRRTRAYYDNVRVRKYVVPEPLHGSWGDEEQQPHSTFWYGAWNEWQTPPEPEKLWTSIVLDNDPTGHKRFEASMVVTVHEYQPVATYDARTFFRVGVYIHSSATGALLPVPAESVALHIEKDTDGSDLYTQSITMLATGALPGYSQGEGLDQTTFIDSTYENRVYHGALKVIGYAVGKFFFPLSVAETVIGLASAFLPKVGPFLDYVDAGPEDLEAISWWENWAHDWGTQNPIEQYCMNSFDWFMIPSTEPESYYGIKVWASIVLRTWDNPFGVSYIETPPVYLRIYNHKPIAPSAPEGPSSGYRWHSLTYTTSTIDPNGDRVMFQFDWGDGSYQWTNWHDSEEPASLSHSWNKKGAYLVRVRAKDETGLVGDWSPYKKVNIINEPGQPCPTLFVWNGLEYVEEGVLDIHSDSDVTFLQGIEPTLVRENHLYKLSLRELDEFTSHIDYVKLYAVDNDAEKHESHLVQAVHNELGHVNSLLLRDDDKRVDLTPMQTIDLKFTTPNTNEIAYFIFEINGYNYKP